jgi:hydrogenase maturation protease
MDFWTRMETPGPDTVAAGGVRLRRGSRVRLRPRSHADVIDLALDGRVAVVEGVEQDDEGGIHLAVTLEDDPGRDLGEARLPGHRFFYSVHDVEPLEPGGAAPDGRRILVAGIGNIFLGDDGFGVEVVRQLARHGTGPGVDVVDFGIRGMDLLYALRRGYHAVIFVDAAARGQPPGTLTVLEPDPPGEGGVAVEGHGMDPAKVLQLARDLGPVPARALVVCCEPATVLEGRPDEDLLVALSEPVRAALDEAVRLVESLVAELADPAGGIRGTGTPKVVT